MSLEGAVLALIAADEASCGPLGAALRGAGATVKTGIVNADALAMLSAPAFDLVMLDVGDEPDRFVALASAIRGDPRTQGLPVVAVASADLPAGRLSPLGAVHVVPAGGGESLLVPLAQALAQKRSASAAVDHTRVLEERLKIALERLSALRTDAQTLTHDARVLCGVVVGFAANLRDGIAGPLDGAQRGHVAQILEAAKDTAAMVDRFGGAARAHTELPAEMGALSAPTRRNARRTLFDLVELTRTTMQLFETVAEQKGVTFAFEGAESVSLWGDTMQVKQVVTNLLVNALKFTPSLGRVTVTVRAVSPRGSASGAAARQHAELVVRDTGPGIPPEERERVFERGVRLTRDERVPGSGIGLAVVREIVAMHGGGVRAEGPPGGGTEMVVSLPLDMRTRREPSVLLVDDAAAAHRIVAALRAHRDASRENAKGEEGVAAALDGCRAVVVVPRGDRRVFDQLLPATGSAPPAPLDGATR